MRSLKKPFVTFLILLLTVSMISTLAPVAQAETWTDINLPYTITESGNYRIAAAWNGSGVGLTINASNVVVDGQNNLLESKESEGDSAVGIFSSGTNVFLRRINQTSAEVGLYCIEGNVTVQDCTFANNTVRGIFAYEIADFTIENCNILYNDEGIWITYANNTSIKNSIINQNGYGISAANSVNVTIVDSSIEGNIVGVISEFGQNLFVDNSNINNNEEIALASLLGTLTFANSQTTNNTVGLYSIMSDQFTVTNATLTGNLAGILGLEGNLTLKESEICDNVLYGGLIQLSNATIKDCNINNNRLGLLSEGNEILRIEDCNVHNNSAIGFVDYWGKATEVISNSFKNNGLNNGVSTRGALVAQDNNCTVTSNVFESNYDALLFGIFEYEQNNTQIYNKNIFTNNDFTFEFNYELPSEYKNQQIYFYNNLVNDTAYVNPDSFNQNTDLFRPKGFSTSTVPSKSENDPTAKDA